MIVAAESSFGPTAKIDNGRNSSISEMNCKARD
jgi:hypothetical protein